MSNLFASSGFTVDAITGGATIWSEAWLASLLNPFDSSGFNGVGDIGQWAGLGISESLLLSELTDNSNLLGDESTVSSFLSSSFLSNNTSRFLSGVDPLTGQSSELQAFFAAAQAATEAGLPDLVTTIQSIGLKERLVPGATGKLKVT